MPPSIVSHANKGSQYLRALDQALCNGNWAEVQELARKTDKHAPQRTTFTLAARTEAQVAQGDTALIGVNEAITRLEDSIKAAKNFPEDTYAARVALAHLYWTKGNDTSAQDVLPPTDQQVSGVDAESLAWFDVCEVKAAVIRVDVTEQDPEGLQKLYASIMGKAPATRTPELRRWIERLLSRACNAAFLSTSSGTSRDLIQALSVFTTWSDFWQRTTPAVGSKIARHDIPRRKVWKMFYDLLSLVLQRGLLYEPPQLLAPNTLPDDQLLEARQRQYATLKRVETLYETLLLAETTFPRANEANTEVEEWVTQTSSNWRHLVGPAWTDEEFGAGGREAVTRNLLNILYRAATKTFHSTSILRRLFYAHAALGEFELAMPAFTSYAELIRAGKDREQRTGERKTDLDDIETAVVTAADAVRVSCRYGDRNHVEKAVGIAEDIHRWNATSAVACRAIGTVKAQWARLTYDTDAREKLQSDAIRHLQQAHAQDEGNLDDAYALGLAYAESRDIAAAVRVLKLAVSKAETTVKSLPLLHLLALCLSARDEYAQALRMCETAIDQIGSIATQGNIGKDAILQIMMSRLALINITEGAEVAIGQSHDLFTLFTKLYGTVADQPPGTQQANREPASNHGTVRSMASTRPKSRMSTLRGAGRLAAHPKAHDDTNGDGTAPIAITVTNEDEKSLMLPSHHKHDGTKRKSAVDAVAPPASAVVGQQHIKDAEKGPHFDVAHNMDGTAMPPPPGHGQDPPRQDERLPAPHPLDSTMSEPHDSSLRDSRYKTSVLVDVWLFVAALYVKAKNFDDASSAIHEATKLAETYEALVPARDLQAIRLYEKGWGARKSVDGLWADVLAAHGDLLSAQDQPFKALPLYDQALAYNPDHPEAIIGVSTILLDIYEEKIPPEDRRPPLQSVLDSVPPAPITFPSQPTSPESQSRDTPAELNRLACRNRAYQLLNTLTRQGCGWDDSEAWLLLARAHELSHHLEKARQALWWVVELEDNEPVRGWRDIDVGNMTL